MAQFLGPLGSGYDHLIQDGLLFLELGQLLLEIGVFFLLVHHAQLQCAVQGLHQWPSRVHNLVIIILYFVLHGLKFLPEEFDKFVVLLEIFIGFTH